MYGNLSGNELCIHIYFAAISSYSLQRCILLSYNNRTVAAFPMNLKCSSTIVLQPCKMDFYFIQTIKKKIRLNPTTMQGVR